MVTLHDLKEMAEAYEKALKAVENAEAALERAKANKDQLNQELVSFLTVAGLPGVMLSDGSILTVETKYRGSIAKDRYDRVVNKLFTMGAVEELPITITSKVLVTSKEEYEELLANSDGEVKIDLHANSLNALVKKAMSADKDGVVDADDEFIELFKPSTENTVKIKK